MTSASIQLVGRLVQRLYDLQHKQERAIRARLAVNQLLESMEVDPDYEQRIQELLSYEHPEHTLLAAEQAESWRSQLEKAECDDRTGS